MMSETQNFAIDPKKLESQGRVSSAYNVQSSDGAGPTFRGRTDTQGGITDSKTPSIINLNADLPKLPS